MTALLILLAIALVAIYGWLCYENRKDLKKMTKANDLGLSVENITNNDRQWMIEHYGKDWRHYETSIKLKNYLDAEDCCDDLESVTNIFQVVEKVGESSDTNVIFITHTSEGTAYEVAHTFWCEDFPLEIEDVILTFRGAFSRLMIFNYPKPHSRNCVLKKPVGPQPCNPQYVFGNTRSQLWMDAKTGETKPSNPAFPESLAKPLGEWP